MSSKWNWKVLRSFHEKSLKLCLTLHLNTFSFKSFEMRNIFQKFSYWCSHAGKNNSQQSTNNNSSLKYWESCFCSKLIDILTSDKTMINPTIICNEIVAIFLKKKWFVEDNTFFFNFAFPVGKTGNWNETYLVLFPHYFIYANNKSRLFRYYCRVKLYTYDNWCNYNALPWLDVRMVMTYCQHWNRALPLGGG